MKLKNITVGTDSGETHVHTLRVPDPSEVDAATSAESLWLDCIQLVQGCAVDSKQIYEHTDWRNKYLSEYDGVAKSAITILTQKQFSITLKLNQEFVDERGENTIEPCIP